MAVVYSATGAGVLILLPASQILIEQIGWRDAYQIFGAAALFLLLPLLMLPWRLFSTGSPHLARSAAADKDHLAADRDGSQVRSNRRQLADNDGHACLVNRLDRRTGHGPTAAEDVGAPIQRGAARIVDGRGQKSG